MSPGAGCPTTTEDGPTTSPMAAGAGCLGTPIHGPVLWSIFTTVEAMWAGLPEDIADGEGVEITAAVLVSHFQPPAFHSRFGQTSAAIGTTIETDVFQAAGTGVFGKGCPASWSRIVVT